jgi:hypothetical protein
MEGGTQVSAGWALWGKYPGTNDDYSVLASSAEPLSAPEFESVLAHFAPGTPPAEPGMPSSLPWIIISRMDIEGRQYLGMAIQKSTRDADAAGRPITMTSYFCMPYPEVADASVSFADLYQVLNSIQLPYEGNGLIQLTVPTLDPAAIAADIVEEFGELTVAAATSLLLSGPVSIVGSNGSTATERLRFLDAVATLLPYGYRADYTAATWSDSGARHQIRLAFAATARSDAVAVRWRTAPAEPIGDEPANTYFRYLRQIRERQPGHGSLTELIRFFARDTTAGLLDQPQHAIERLREFDLPAIVLDAARNRVAQPADVREVFTRSRIGELPVGGRQVLLAELIGFGDPQDWPLIQRFWDSVVGDDPTVMLTALVSTCRRLLWTPTPSLAIKEQLTLAANHGLLDSLLAELITLPDAELELAGGLSAAAQLLADWVLDSPGGHFPSTQQAMAGNQLLACELLAQRAGSEREARATLAWLGPPLRDFLYPFAVVLGDAPGNVSQQELGQLARYNMTCVRSLLQAASYSGRLPQVLPAFVGWLLYSTLGNDGMDDAESLYWHDLIWALNAADAASQAWLDLALLASGNDPRYIRKAADWPSQERYDECLTEAWAELAASGGPAADDQLTRGFTGYLDRTRWTADGKLVDVVVDLTQRLAAAGPRERLEAAVAERLAARPEGARRESAKIWLAKVRSAAPDTGDGGGILLSLRQPPPDVTESQLADLCVRGYRADLNPGEVCQALADSQIIVSGISAADFLKSLRPGLRAVRARQDPAEFLLWFMGRFADGTFGPHVAEDFRRVAVQDARYEIGYHLDVLYIAATGGQKGALPKLSDADIAALDWIPRSFTQILREAKKRPGRSRLLGGKHVRGEEKDDHPDGNDARSAASHSQHDPDQVQKT